MDLDHSRFGSIWLSWFVGKSRTASMIFIKLFWKAHSFHCLVNTKYMCPPIFLLINSNWAKGQLISKWFLVSSISSKKRTKIVRFPPKNDFRSFFWGNRRHHKVISKLTDLYHQNLLQVIPSDFEGKNSIFFRVRHCDWWF